MVQRERVAQMNGMQLPVLTLFLLLTASCSTATKTEDGVTLTRIEASRDRQGLGLNFPLQKAVLPNGLSVLMVEDHTVPIVSYQTWINAGSVDEEFGFTGIAHLFEHLMFKGSEKYGPRAFFNELEAKGAQVNAYTSRDYTVFHETFVPSLLDRVIALESDRLRSLKIDEESLFTERQVVMEERRMRLESAPEGRVQEALWSLVFRAHPYRWPVIGFEEDLTRITVEDLKNFFRKYYQPGNTLLVIVGDFDPEVTLKKIVSAYGSIPGRTRVPRSIRTEPSQREERRIEIQDGVATDQITLAYPITSAHDDDTHPLDVLSSILLGGVSSRAHQRLVEEKQIALGVGGVSFTPAYPGIFTLRAALKAGHRASEAEAEFDALIREIQEKGVTQEEVKVAVRQLLVQTVDSVRTAHGLGTLLGTVQLILGDPLAFRTDLKKYEAVTPADVSRVARKYLIPSKKNVVVLKPGVRLEERSAQ